MNSFLEYLHKECQPILEQDLTSNGYEEIILRTYRECLKQSVYFRYIEIDKTNVYKTEISNWSDTTKVSFIIHNIQEVYRYYNTPPKNHIDTRRKLNKTRKLFVNLLLSSKMSLTGENIQRLVQSIIQDLKLSLCYFYVDKVLIQIIHKKRDKKDTKFCLHIISQLLDTYNNLPEDLDYANFKTTPELLEKTISTTYYILTENKQKQADKIERFLGKDDFSSYANNFIENKISTGQIYWYSLIRHTRNTKGNKPTQSFLTESLPIIRELGSATFEKVLIEWLTFLINLKGKIEEHTENNNGEPYTFTRYKYLSSVNIDSLRGFIWMCSCFHSENMVTTIKKLALRTYQIQPKHGPIAPALGNACLYFIYKLKRFESISYLSRFKQKVKLRSTQKLIQKYLLESAQEQGVTTDDIEDMAIDSFGLTDGNKEIQFNNFTSTIEITQIGKTTLRWFKEDGSEQKTIPKAVKEQEEKKLKEVKATVKQINQTTSTQRDRIDQMFKAKRVWTWENFNKWYVDHGLMIFLTKRIIWNIHQDKETFTVINFEDSWRTVDGKIITPQHEDTISLWHPIQSTIEEVQQWRTFLTEHEIQQPIKQAFREIYILTDAELQTKSYSNRMAAHILKQHQFSSLAKIRGWNYTLRGNFDGGFENATLHIPEHTLRAEYWINEINDDDAYSGSGIFSYIATDQVRFINTENNELVDLIDVPPIVLSEVMRDVDLFVGVASIGNDPQWQDSGGEPQYQTYWENFSFGNLSELAKTRKSILENIVPRLKIRNVASIEGKFLIVKGKLRTYKIHIGSTNILMEPNDQYLCIVPDRSKKNLTKNLFLPFEGDSGLSVILSKAFLLAEDDKITDPTILSQINY